MHGSQDTGPLWQESSAADCGAFNEKPDQAWWYAAALELEARSLAGVGFSWRLVHRIMQRKSTATIDKTTTTATTT
jgi:hypothetical protein